MTTIAFTTDLAADEGPALTTAVALAAKSGAKLVTVHASTGAESEAPTPASGLAGSWGLSIEHEPMIHTCCDDVTDTLLDAIGRIRPELVVTGTHSRNRWLQLVASSVAEGLARNVAVPTLIVPLSGSGIADARTGAIVLERVIVPAGDKAAARAGLEAAAWLARLARIEDLEVVLLHVEDGFAAPEVVAPEGIRIAPRTAKGPIEQAIVEAATGSCAIVMATRGHDSVGDTLGGSHTERVIRQVRCPVLSVPIR